jgi:hypothetical protein
MKKLLLLVISTFFVSSAFAVTPNDSMKVSGNQLSASVIAAKDTEAKHRHKASSHKEGSIDIDEQILQREIKNAPSPQAKQGLENVLQNYENAQKDNGVSKAKH